MINFKPKTRDELLVDMGIIADYDKMFYDIFAGIYQAAGKKLRTCTYVFPENATKEQKDKIYIEIANLGYDNNGTGPDCYKRIVITW